MSIKYHPTIGLEIHAELKTKTKMFCDSKNDPDEKEPNVNVCPVCLGHPGTLPVINKEAVKHILKVGLAVGGELADFTEFDRKNYFYPDIPKGYQISQYQNPLIKGGSLNNVQLTRIHLEEDTATSKHDQGDFSLIDFNRAGVPLMELVTEPVIGSAEEAASFARELQLLLQYLGVAEANMEKGEMRLEANISISDNPKQFGTKVEVKNLNSFRSVERAIKYEINRMTEILEKGEKVIQETRGWDEIKQKTFSQREKEESHDYRYFPDPDLPVLYISEIPEFQKEVLLKEIPETPREKRTELKKIGIKDADTEVLINNKDLLENFFEKIINPKDKKFNQIASNLIVSSVLSGLDYTKIKPEHFSSLVSMSVGGSLSSTATKTVLMMLPGSRKSPEEIAEEKKLLQKHDMAELKLLMEKVISSHPQVVIDYKNGKESALQYLVGQIMKESGGSANPVEIQALLKKSL
jgi:aspartyl-tRNA(Asn)/glutamyl-tRNA(Gln) amidotransferase subunit B